MSERTPRVLVGVDGSAVARDAVAFAVHEAVMRSATLVAVMSVELPDYAWIDPYFIRSRPEDEYLRVAEEKLRSILAEVGTGGLPVEPIVTPIAPAVALVDRSVDADLLVVGSRGRGGFRGLLLGSVSLQCVLHARCPVTVVRPDPRPAEDEAPRRSHTLEDARRETTAPFL